MKKKKLIENLNRYFSAEENALRVPPVETMQVYNDFHAFAETQAPRAERVWRPSRNIWRVAVIAVCLTVLIAAAVVISASVGEPHESDASAYGDRTNKTSDVAQSLSAGEASEGVVTANPDMPDAPENDGNGIGNGGETFERYYPDELYDLYCLSYIVTWDEIYAAENKLFAENEYFLHDQLPPLYMMLHELNINKEAFIRVRDAHCRNDYTDEQIEWLFSDADIQTIQAVFKLDTTFLYEGRLYNLYELLRLDDSQLKEMTGTDEMNAYMKDLDVYLKDLERKALAEGNSYYHPAQSEWKRLSGLMDELKAKLEGTV